jgi:hypothetical protein
MTDERMPTNEPDEIITVAHCRGCEQLSFPGDLDQCGTGPSDQVSCPRCGTKIAARDFFDYVEYRVVEYYE